MSTAMQVRESGLADVEILAALHADCFEDCWSAQSMIEVISSPGVCAWIAVAAPGRSSDLIPVGFAIARVAADEAELLSIGVSASSRRQGVASALLGEVIHRAATRGARRLFLEVAEDNKPAQTLYANHGFSTVGRRPDYYRPRRGPPVAALTLRRHLSVSRWRWGVS